MVNQVVIIVKIVKVVRVVNSSKAVVYNDGMARTKTHLVQELARLHRILLVG